MVSANNSKKTKRRAKYIAAYLSKYKKPARFNDELNVVTSISSLGKASIHFKQSVFLQSSHHVDSGAGPLTDAEIKVACLDAEKFLPQAIPASITEKINQEFYCGS